MKNKGIKNKDIKNSDQSQNQNTSLWTATIQDINKSPFTKEQEEQINKIIKDPKNDNIDFSKPTPEIEKLIKMFES